MFAIVLLTTVYTDRAAADNVDIFCDSGALNANNQRYRVTVVYERRLAAVYMRCSVL